MPTSALARVFVVSAALGLGLLRAAEPLPFHAWADRPPMGWNSWDCFATTVTEEQTKAHADIMAEKLARFGYDIVTVDIQWYEPNATGFDYRPGAKLDMDEFGRLIPAANKFPSAVEGRGFKPLADYVHAKGLKLGVHFMRGIPRQAVAAKTPVKGTSVTAADIADVKSMCSWNSDMYGVDLTKPGAQEYYNSLFEQFAAWGIDFIKIDDLSEPYHQAEIEAIRRAIDRTGRPIVFSTSPGPTPVAEGAHVSSHANMWRISGDFWDSWPALVEQFARLRDWTPFRGPGHFPDADMLPLGTISMGKRQTNFTPDEQVTLLSLWSIARSPLILGADLTKLDAATLARITNEEVIAVDQFSTHNRELFQRDGFYGWAADIPGTEDQYLALFNTRPKPGDLDPARAAFTSPPISRDFPGHGVRIDLDVTGATKLFLVVDDGRDGDGRADVVWSEPTLITAAGSQKLTELKWVSASSRRGTQVSTALGASGKATIVAGQPVPFGITARPKSVIEYDLPAGCTRFRAFAGLDDSGAAPPASPWPAPSVRFMVFTQSPYATEASAAVPVKLSELGFNGACRIRDLWQKKDLDPVTGEFAPIINAHGAGLYRVSAIRPRPMVSSGPVDPALVARLAELGQRPIRVHDPSTIVKCKDEYWIFCTGRGTPSFHSRDLEKWEPGPRVFEQAPAWVAAAVPGNRNLNFWAPDIMYLGGRYLLYYSVSTFGKNTSAIALATNPTLDPADPAYQWTDGGVVIQSSNVDDFNTIDPAITQDVAGRLWLAFGSFWSGIKMIQLYPATGKRLAADPTIYALAYNKSIEAAFIYRHGNFYYLFVNWGICCRGMDSTYEIRVGRSEKITGPYLDREGRDLEKNGGSLFMATDGPFIGPGHTGIFREGDKYWVSCHFYDATQGGTPAYAIRPLTWTIDGWPVAGLNEATRPAAAL